jgi:hypothetical protein
MLNKEELKNIISTLQRILSKLEEFKPCSKCSRPVAARDLCSKHYSQWRREYCRERQIKKLSDQPKVIEPDPRQAQLFIERLDSIIEF